MENEDITRFLWSIVSDFQKSNSTISNKDDLYQEAQIAAALAVAKYDVSRGASLFTFIKACVLNKLRDVRELESKIIKNEILEDATNDGLDCSIEDFEFMLTMKQILSGREYEVFVLHYVYGYTTREVAEKTKIGQVGVNRCLHRILLKYKSIEESLEKSLTSKRLQTSWLDDSLQ